MADLAAGLIGVSHAEPIRLALERPVLNHQVPTLPWRVTEDNHLEPIGRAHSQTAIRVEIRAGFRLPNLAGAIGRCVAAVPDLPSVELRRRFASLRGQSPHCLCKSQEQVALPRDRCRAPDSGNLHGGLNGLASSVPGRDGRPRFGFSGVSIVGQQAQNELEQLGADLHEPAVLAGTCLFPRRALPEG